MHIEGQLLTLIFGENNHETIKTFLKHFGVCDVFSFIKLFLKNSIEIQNTGNYSIYSKYPQSTPTSNPLLFLYSVSLKFLIVFIPSYTFLLFLILISIIVYFHQQKMLEIAQSLVIKADDAYNCSWIQHVLVNSRQRKIIEQKMN